MRWIANREDTTVWRFRHGLGYLCRFHTRDPVNACCRLPGIASYDVPERTAAARITLLMTPAARRPVGLRDLVAHRELRGRIGRHGNGGQIDPRADARRHELPEWRQVRLPTGSHRTLPVRAGQCSTSHNGGASLANAGRTAPVAPTPNCAACGPAQAGGYDRPGGATGGYGGTTPAGRRPPMQPRRQGLASASTTGRREHPDGSPAQPGTPSPDRTSNALAHSLRSGPPTMAASNGLDHAAVGCAPDSGGDRLSSCQARWDGGMRMPFGSQAVQSRHSGASVAALKPQSFSARAAWGRTLRHAPDRDRAGYSSRRIPPRSV